MQQKYPYLQDKKFLKKIISSQIKTFFVKIIVLNWDERPIESIEGRVISANFNLDGESSVRRTGSISLIIDDSKNIKSLITLNKKIQVQIGYKNTTKEYLDYPILWFPLGIYIVTAKSLSHSASDATLNLQLSDKMCLLNGQCGGIIPAATVFDNYETIDENGQQVILRPTIYQIIQELVNHFGGEQLGKIIISDLQTRVKQVMKWTNSSPLYFVQKNGQYQLTMDANYYESLLKQQWYDVIGSPFEYGTDVGYIYTDFTYPGDLIGDAGSAVTDILDTIIQTLGNYEYFYDVQGNFIFQEKKNYLNNSQTKYITQGLNGQGVSMADYILHLYQDGSLKKDDYLLNMRYGKSIFQFEDSNLIESYSNNPEITEIKNDFVVWGIRTTPEETEIPVRYHLAIDKKPSAGNIYKVFKYEDPNDGLIKYHAPIEFSNKNNFPQKGAEGVFYYDKSGNTIYKWTKDANQGYGYSPIQASLINIKTKDWRTQLYLQGVAAEPYGVDSNYYYTELVNEWPKLFEIVEGDSYYQDKLKDDVLKSPWNIDFYLDIIEPQESELSQLQIDNIGRRTLVLNQDNNVNCVFEPQVPDIIILPILASNPSSEMGKMRAEADRRGQKWIQVIDKIYENLEIGGNFNSGYQTIRQLLHQYTKYNESISINCLPIYFLEPNTRIWVQDDKSDIFGDYMINSISFAIDSESTMSINCTKAIEKI